MAFALDAVAAKLEELGFGTVGSTIFVDYLPDGEGVPSQCYSLWESAGFANNVFEGIASSMSPRFTLYTRGVARDYLTPRRMAYDAYVAMSRLGQFDFDVVELDSTSTIVDTRRVRILGIAFDSTPALLERDDDERCLFTASGTVTWSLWTETGAGS